MNTRVLASCLTLSLLVAGAPLTQEDSEKGGQGEIAFQGYYQGGNSNPLTNITGTSANFRSFFPGIGLLTGQIESYGGEGRYRAGENYIDLNGATWFGYRWRLTGGDFRVSTSLLPFPFTNIFLPELAAEGVKVEAFSANRRYTLFYGVETLAAGPRVPFRFRVPQNVLGASVIDRIGGKLEIGARAIHLSTAGADPLLSDLIAPGQDSRSSTTLAAFALFKASANLQFYGEAAASATSGSATVAAARRKPFSFTVGPVWKSRKLTVKANYVHQTASYLPVAGYFLGDRSGPYVEAQYTPVAAVELFGSASDYRNNIENSPHLPTFRSRSTSAGASLSLPSRFTASAQLSTIDFSIKEPNAPEPLTSHNQQFVATLGRPMANHTLHVSYRELAIKSDGREERQRSAEIEDVMQFKSLSLGAAVRNLRLVNTISRDTLFIRGSARAQYGRLSAYAYIERGNDLANLSVFLTSTFNTAVFGVAVRLNKVWNLHVEASRNSFTTELNPENVFLLQNQGAFVTSVISGMNQWTTYFRLSKSLRWGRGLPAGDIDRYTADQIPITGAIEGTVLEQELAGNVAAKGVPVVLDDGRVVTTNDLGLFRFSRVPEGRHTVSIAVNQLPADFDPGPNAEMTFYVRARRVANADLTVRPLVSFSGKIVGPEGTSLAGVIVRLYPTNRYTTPTPDGRFSFFNLSEGEYDLRIEPKSLPEFALLDRMTAHVSLTKGLIEDTTFRLSIDKPEKPIRRTFDKPW